jgi:SAM-dependent methyltransferase
MKILDATCGFKGIWYQKNHPFVTFMDRRKGTYDFDNPSTLSRYRKYKVNPDIVSEWKDAPFPDNYFDLVVFDPPHLIKTQGSKISNMMQAYGYLDKKTWRQDLKQGIKKLFDVLKPEGVFILKWCENSVKVDEIIKLCPYSPMFGSNTKSKGHTANFWILFIKYNVNKTVGDFSSELAFNSANSSLQSSLSN